MSDDLFADVELFDESPAAITRPLSLTGGHAFAALWPLVRRKSDRRRTAEDSPELAALRAELSRQWAAQSTPSAVLDRELVLVRDDGALFGDAFQPLETIGLRVSLNEAPPAEKLWTVAGLRRYLAGERPRPAEVFAQVSAVVDHFIDFEQSLAPQRAMCELVACYILATWFLDAFNVIGFLWPSGDRGSGKTKLLTLVAELSYLGQVILAGGSYATLRDLADYGATLAFDDAEALSDPKRGDANKRNLLLAGNRRGSRVTLKDMVYGQWQVRYVNTYCARLFSATQLPDPILASRTIVIPLVRTPNRARANAEVLEGANWPLDRARLLDDLWALALAHLPQLPAYERAVAEVGPLSGRGQERWRGVLAVAWWLDANGVSGLRERMEAIAQAHQSEATTLETPDLTALVVRALAWAMEDAVRAKAETLPEQLAGMEIVAPAGAIAAWAAQLADEVNLPVEKKEVTSVKVGQILGKLRFHPSRSSLQRGWRVSLREVLRYCEAYAIELPQGLQVVKSNSQKGG